MQVNQRVYPSQGNGRFNGLKQRPPIFRVVQPSSLSPNFFARVRQDFGELVTFDVLTEQVTKREEAPADLRFDQFT